MGCPYAPTHLDPPICVDAPPVCLDGPLYVSMPHIWTPSMFGFPHMFGHDPYTWMSLYVWMPCCMFGSPAVCLDALLYVWMPPCLNTTHMFGCPLYVWTPL